MSPDQRPPVSDQTPTPEPGWCVAHGCFIDVCAISGRGCTWTAPPAPPAPTPEPQAATRCLPEKLPPLERIGWLVTGCIIPDGPGGSCLDCGAERDADDVTEHADHCGLSAALTAYYEFRRTEAARRPSGAVS